MLKYRIAIFLDGEFWHGYHWSERKERLKANREYWIEKIEENKVRDARSDQKLTELGWTPIHFWEKEVKKDLQSCLRTIDSIVMNTPPENRRSDRRSPTARPQKSYTPAVGQTPCV